MKTDYVKKGLAIGIIFVFLSTACLPVIANEGKPDLYVTNVFTYRDAEWYPVTYWIVIGFGNRGNASANGTLQFNFTSKRLLFGKIPFKTIITTERSYDINFDFYPGCPCFYAIQYKPIQFGFGYFKINCTVNPHKIIEESNYDNNYYERKYFAFLGSW